MERSGCGGGGVKCAGGYMVEGAGNGKWEGEGDGGGGVER